MYRVYGALLALAWAAVLPYELLMSKLKRRPLVPWRERLGYVAAPIRPGGFWIHAVSVGEVRLALRLLPGLRDAFPGSAIHLTTGTATGRTLGAGGAGGTPPESIAALPFDLPFAVARRLEIVRPRAVLIVETEIWPNLARLCAGRGVPVVLVNGRISPRTYPRYRALRRFVSRVLRDYAALGMQSEEDARRIRDLGGPPDRIRVTGNVKFDLEPPRRDPAAVRARLGVADGIPLFVAGSTAPGEEPHVLRAFAILRATEPLARLVLAPRHPEDFGTALRSAERAGHSTTSWSRTAGTGAMPRSDPWDVLVLDRLGVLPEIYAAADLVFVGGSLVPRGGQNVLEPAAVGRPVLFGPRVENFRAACDALLAAGGGFLVRDGDELGRELVRLRRDRAAFRVAAAMAARVVEANRGALARTLVLIEEVAGAGARRVTTVSGS